MAAVTWANMQTTDLSGHVRAANQGVEVMRKSLADAAQSLTDYADNGEKTDTDALNAALQLASSQDEVDSIMTRAKDSDSWLNMESVNATVGDRQKAFEATALHDSNLLTQTLDREVNQQALKQAKLMDPLLLTSQQSNTANVQQDTIGQQQDQDVTEEQRDLILQDLQQKLNTQKQTYEQADRNNPLLLEKLQKEIDKTTVDIAGVRANTNYTNAQANSTQSQQVIKELAAPGDRNLTKSQTKANQLSSARDALKLDTEKVDANNKLFVNSSLSDLMKTGGYQDAASLTEYTQLAKANGVVDTEFYKLMDTWKLDALRKNGPKFDLSSTTTDQELIAGVQQINEAAASFPGSSPEARKNFVDQLMVDSGLATAKQRMDATTVFNKYKKEKTVDTVLKIEAENAKQRAVNGSSYGGSNKRLSKAKTMEFFATAYGEQDGWFTLSSPTEKFFESLDKNLFAVREGSDEATYTVKERERAYAILSQIVRFDKTGADEMHVGDQESSNWGWGFAGGEGSMEDLKKEQWEQILADNDFKRDADISKPNKNTFDKLLKKLN